MYTQEDKDMDAKVMVMLGIMLKDKKEEFMLAIMHGKIGTAGAEDGTGGGLLVCPDFYLELVARYDDMLKKHKRKAA